MPGAGRDGASASAASAASTGVSSLTSRRSASSRAIVPGAGDASARRRRGVTVGAHARRAGRAARRPAGWSPPASAARVTVPPVTSAAARNGAALDRSGSTTRSPAGDGAGRDPPYARLGRLGVDAGRRAARASVMSMCGCDGTGSAPVWRDLDALVVAGAGEQQPGHELRRRRRVDAAPRRRGTRAAAEDGERQPAAAAVVDLDAGLPQAVEQRRHRALAGVRRRRRTSTSPSASAATGGTKRMTVPASPVSTSPPCSGPGVTTQSAPSSATSTPSARRASAISSGVAGPQRRDEPGRAVGQRGEHAAARLVSDFDPGSSTRASQRPVRRAAPPSSAHASTGAASLPHQRQTCTSVRIRGMCGRYVSVQVRRRPAQRVRRGRRRPTARAHRPDYNVAPTKPVRAIVNRPLRDAAAAGRRRRPGSCG